MKWIFELTTELTIHYLHCKVTAKMLRFKPDALSPFRRPSDRKFNIKHLEDCFNDDFEFDFIWIDSHQGQTQRKNLTLLEAEQGVKSALFNKLLVDGVIFDEKYFFSQTALFLAAEYDSTDALELLYSAGADLNAEDMFGDTALFLAVSGRAIHCVKWLVSHGANVSHKTPEGETALHVAASTSADCVQILINAGADVNAPKTKGVTPLMLAALNCSDAVEYLIQNGADVNAKSIYGDSALLYAVRSGNVNASRILAKHVDDIHCSEEIKLETMCNRYGYVRIDSPLVLAIDGGHTEIMRILLENGADPNSYSRSKNPPNHVLHRVLHNKRLTPILPKSSTLPSTDLPKPESSSPGVSCLLEYGATVDTKDQSGHTPLMIATKNCDVESMNTLIKAGADLNAVNSAGTTALYLAVLRRDVELVSLLMKSGAKISFELQNAIFIDQRLVETMVVCGASPMPSICERLSREGLANPVSPLYVALHYGYLELASFFVSRGFLTRWDLRDIPKDLKIIKVLNKHKYSRGGVPETLSCLFDLCDLQSGAPCSLSLRSFVAVSDALGFQTDRHEKVKTLELPASLQRRLLFQETQCNW